MNWNAVIGITSTLVLFLPVALIIAFRLYYNRSLQALLLYYLFGFIYNLMMQEIIPIPAGSQKILGTLYNYLDTPFMLLFLIFFCTGKCRVKNIYIALIIFLIYELIIGIIYGFHVKANAYVLGPGIIITLFLSILFFIRHIKITIVYNKGLGKTLMLASVVFSYGCFSIIYIFHYLQKPNAVNDIFLLYFITSLISSILMSFGLVFINRHLKHLEEVKIARKELQMFFNT